MAERVEAMPIEAPDVMAEEETFEDARVSKAIGSGRSLDGRYVCELCGHEEESQDGIEQHIAFSHKDIENPEAFQEEMRQSDESMDISEAETRSAEEESKSIEELMTERGEE